MSSTRIPTTRHQLTFSGQDVEATPIQVEEEEPVAPAFSPSPSAMPTLRRPLVQSASEVVSPAETARTQSNAVPLAPAQTPSAVLQPATQATAQAQVVEGTLSSGTLGSVDNASELGKPAEGPAWWQWAAILAGAYMLIKHPEKVTKSLKSGKDRLPFVGKPEATSALWSRSKAELVRRYKNWQIQLKNGWHGTDIPLTKPGSSSLTKSKEVKPQSSQLKSKKTTDQQKKLFEFRLGQIMLDLSNNKITLEEARKKVAKLPGFNKETFFKEYPAFAEKLNTTKAKKVLRIKKRPGRKLGSKRPENVSRMLHYNHNVDPFIRSNKDKLTHNQLIDKLIKDYSLTREQALKRLQLMGVKGADNYSDLPIGLQYLTILNALRVFG